MGNFKEKKTNPDLKQIIMLSQQEREFQTGEIPLHIFQSRERMEPSETCLSVFLDKNWLAWLGMLKIKFLLSKWTFQLWS